MELEVSVLGKELQKLLLRVEMVIQSRVIVFCHGNNNNLKKYVHKLQKYFEVRIKHYTTLKII